MVNFFTRRSLETVQVHLPVTKVGWTAAVAQVPRRWKMAEMAGNVRMKMPETWQDVSTHAGTHTFSTRQDRNGTMTG